MVLCVFCDCQMRYRSADVPQSSVASILGGAITFVGHLDEVDAFIVARQDLHDATSPWPATPLFEDGPVHGDIAIIAVGDEGEEIDVDVDRAMYELSRHVGLAAIKCVESAVDA